ncbi:sialate O-acetylesterase [Escherichia coli]|uniref:Sialate O-acetylesterase domain-containing protein n=2 Tax=Escherichia coli TaxID=562 RepID=A0A6L6ZKZ1_ECOLX|nr:sialate O-acetylesterase [Escherichia coli]MED7449878.1 sialate O-acetylesterase [Escherichia coli O157]EFK3338528.1 sialate O-acetylesterase [Escherichia coli]EGO4138833.1 sialate O-acetylesterase [Escherichia coli]EGO4197276.1 sialate O-acetylesterase [Escherichia coli]EHL6437025.1 hypothetical protein [Escherichia coli]
MFRFVFLVFMFLVNITTPSVAKTFTAFILTGQSNSLGAIKGNFASPQNMSPIPAMKFWHHNFGEYCTGTPSQSWGYVSPQYESQIVMGPEYGFSQEIQSYYSNPELIHHMGIIKASRDGGGNSNWIKGHGDAYAIVLSTVEDALRQLPAKGYDKVRIAGLLYLQGESDKGQEIALSSVRLLNFIKNIKSDISDIKIKGLDIDINNMIVLLGENASWHGIDKKFNGETTRDNLYKTAQQNKDIIWVSSRDLSKITTGDNMGVHYNGDAQLTLGKRFARAWINAYEM